MADVKEIEASVREGDGFPGATRFRAHLLERLHGDDLGGGATEGGAHTNSAWRMA
jgi:hypothetical protein